MSFVALFLSRASYLARYRTAGYKRPYRKNELPKKANRRHKPPRKTQTKAARNHQTAHQTKTPLILFLP